MIRLAELLRQEFDAQLKTQCPEARKPVHLRFEHTTFPKDLVPVERSRVEIPARPNADEQKVLARLDGTAPQHPRRELRPFERVDEYHVSHLIFSKEYSIILSRLSCTANITVQSTRAAAPLPPSPTGLNTT